MEREGDTIIFNRWEQAEYNMPETTTASDAAEIAYGFNEVANKLNQRSIDLINEAYFDQDSTVSIAVKPLAERAIHLGTLAARIMRLCPAEYVTVMSREGPRID